MTVFLSSALRNSMLQGSSLKEELDGGFIYIYAGTVPADADTALDMVGTHTQLAKIAADAVPVDSGVRGLTFATASGGAIAKNSGETWSAVVNFDGKDAAQAGLSPLTATFFRFGGGGNTAKLPAPVQSAASTATTGGTLAAGTYFYVITATNAAGETTRSNEISITTTGATSTVTLNWDAVPGATGYRVYRGTVAGTQTEYYVVGTVITYVDTNAASTAGNPPVADACRVIGSATTPRIQGSVATSGGDINLTSVSLSDNGSNTTGLSTFEVRVSAS